MPESRPKRLYGVYLKKNKNEKLGYVKGVDRKAARKEAAAKWGGNSDDYFVAAAR